jgi:hypothetical protein
MFADGVQGYLAHVDPCLYTGGEELCPANGGPSDLGRMDFDVHYQLSTPNGKRLLYAKNVTAQLWLDITPAHGQTERTACVQTRLRGDDESGRGSNSTSSTGAGASSGSGHSTNDEKSGASVPRVAFGLVM